MTKDTYIYYSSDTNLSAHPHNANNNFTVELNNVINNRDTDLSIGLSEIDFTNNKPEEYVYITLDCIESSQVETSSIQILRKIKSSWSLVKIYYLPLNKDVLTEIKVSLYHKVDGKFVPADLTGVTSLVLNVYRY